MNSKKVRLDYSENYEFCLLGISSFEKDYRLIWNINNLLNFQFYRTSNHQVFNRKSETEQGFSSFSYKDEDRFLQYTFIANKSEEVYLIEELRNIDYFLIIRGETGDNLLTCLKNDLSGIENVQAVFVIDPSNLKNRARLIQG